jgi:hypothetical protein
MNEALREGGACSQSTVISLQTEQRASLRRFLSYASLLKRCHIQLFGEKRKRVVEVKTKLHSKLESFAYFHEVQFV